MSRSGFGPGLVLRFAGFAVLAAGLWLAVGDAARSIAAGEWVLTPLRGNWAAVWPRGLAGFEGWAEAALPVFLHGHFVLPLLGFPGWAVLGALAILLGIAGARAGVDEIPDAGSRAG